MIPSHSPSCHLFLLRILISFFPVGVLFGANHCAFGQSPAPVKNASTEEIHVLIGQLGSEVFAKRERAARRLLEIGEPALELLGNSAEKNSDLETRLRAKMLIEQIRRGICGEVRQFRGHTRGLIAIDISKDGKRILTGAWDNTMRLWDVESGRKLLCIKKHTRQVTDLVFLAGDNQAASASADGTVRIWDLKTEQQLRLIKIPSGQSYGIARSPDGKFITFGDELMIRLHDAESGKEIQSFKGHTARVQEVNFSPDGKRLLTVGNDRTIRIWDVKTGAVLQILKGHKTQLWTATFSPDGANVLSGGNDKVIRMWDLKTGNQIRTFEGHTSMVFDIQYSPEGNRIISVGSNGTMRAWNVKTGKQIHCFEGHTGQVCDVCWLPDGRSAISVSHDKTARLWRVPRH